jgi:hypothetical protein
MEDRKWYVKVHGNGEDDRFSVVALTKEEYDAVLRFVNADVVIDGWGGGTYCDIYDIPFDTKEEAEIAIHNSQTDEFDHSFDLYLHKMYDEPEEEE